MRINLFLLLLFTFLSVNGLSQDPKVDSLETILETNIPDTSRLETLLELTDHLELTDFEKGLLYCHQLIHLAKKLDSEYYLVKGYNGLLHIHYYKNSSLDTMSVYFEKVITETEDIKDQNLMSDIFDIMAIHYRKVGLDEKAMTYHQKALEIVTAQKDTLKMAKCLNNMALLLENRGETEQAKVYHLKALDYSRQINKLSYIAGITNNMGNIYMHYEEYDTALVLYKEALDIKRTLGKELSLVTTLANI